MTDSNSFSSLLALVDSHLSKSSFQMNDISDISKSISISPFNRLHKDDSDTCLSSSSQILPLPPFNVIDSPINNILAEQVSNMIKAKEKKEQEAKDNIAHKLKNLNLDDNYIDLVKAIKESKGHHVPINDKESRISLDLVLKDSEEIVLDNEPKMKEQVFSELPYINNKFYILKEKVNKAGCSPFGKVLTARWRPVAAPYLHERIISRVKRFDFNLRSPCNGILEKSRWPTLPNHIQLGIFDVNPIINK
ncbi:hypothetical protein K1T71_007610 [Dendrolimus kikuchii]|uniref:Uncharacterized protein n=1 Tax=Dendrolimus kikuchii TaxID=765133 RepID=A0ACC1CXK3_9NEOP|nr:hypothetical protein K1T71_007610 [Dendrolimus kikuchii]